jgi:two-component system, chemotaxis family, sensor histidine kinase and response regulator PixL
VTQKTILIVDDDQHLLLGLAARLRGSGYWVICASDAVSGLNLAQKKPLDLIILDLGLPQNEGFEFLEQKRRLTDIAIIPVIVLSARDPVKNNKLVLDAGAVAFFQKPPDNRQFLSAIRRTLGEPSVPSAFARIGTPLTGKIGS